MTIRAAVALVDRDGRSIGVRIDSDAATSVYIYSWDGELRFDRSLPHLLLSALAESAY